MGVVVWTLFLILTRPKSSSLLFLPISKFSCLTSPPDCFNHNHCMFLPSSHFSLSLSLSSLYSPSLCLFLSLSLFIYVWQSIDCAWLTTQSMMMSNQSINQLFNDGPSCSKATCVLRPYRSSIRSRTIASASSSPASQTSTSSTWSWISTTRAWSASGYSTKSSQTLTMWVSCTLEEKNLILNVCIVTEITLSHGKIAWKYLSNVFQKNLILNVCIVTEIKMSHQKWRENI